MKSKIFLGLFGNNHARAVTSSDPGVLIKTEDGGKIRRNHIKIKIKVLETFKSQAGERKVIEKFLFTNKGGSLCGVKLKADTYYIVTGYYADILKAKGKKKKTRMVTGSCDYIKEIKDMSPPTCTAEKIKLVF
ncbi:uncharacterized protein LOC123536556 isoform X2 [Mercenaria mercenaria]|uniref:uncharacterized protein LOC123536556 isoform X2 n=1 Tax=Mercenaria mercenaria TaxID=6596 RepID=UPI00234F90FB|nr:uncharacterized protein LOC123536556 isoform X2 [Mercenaria mercenaria]